MALLNAELFSVQSRISLFNGKQYSFHPEVPDVLWLGINSGYFIGVKDINLEK